VSDAMNTDERLRIKGLSASACSLCRSYSFISEQCSNRPRNGRLIIAFHSCSETKYIFTHFWCGRFCFGRFGTWPFWTFTVAVLVSFVAVLDVIQPLIGSRIWNFDWYQNR